MARFKVRVNLNYDFVMDNLDIQTEYWEKLKKEIPSMYRPELICKRFVYGVYILTAFGISNCEEIIYKAWSNVYPNGKDLIDLNIIPWDEKVNYEIVGSMYGAFYGGSAYLDEVTELSLYLPLLQERRGIKAYRMQSYLFAIDPGCGFTTLISSLGDYLQKMGIYRENNEEKRYYIEYILGKETTLGKISANDLLDRLFDLSSADEDYNVVGLDISYYMDGEKLDELRDLVKSIYRLQDDYIFVFRIPFVEKSTLNRIAKVLSDIMNVKVLEFAPLHNALLLERFWDAIRDNGYNADESIIDLFFKRVSDEKQDGRFYGYKTVDKIAQEFVIKKALSIAHNMQNGKTIEKYFIKKSDLEGYVKEEVKEKSGYDELHELIGMEDIEKRVKEMVAQVKISMENEKLDRPCIHMRFLGAPGTGKTTVARIIGKIFKEEGILRKGAFFEYSSRALCAEYIGQTAVKTATICREAYGSVLFIDEAYALYQDDTSNSDYGKEALTTLIAEMENHRDDMLVIMAGYTDDMETLMKGNAGLRSRMPYMLDFKNYTRDQLYQIFMLMVRKHFDYDESLEKAAKDYFMSLTDKYITSKEFANARFVRNLYERTWAKAALRTTLSGSKKVVVTREDFLSAAEEKEFKEKLDVRKTVGF